MATMSLSNVVVKVSECRHDLVSTLLSFTQPAIDLSKEDVSSSLWSKMLREVVAYISSAPSVYLSGLSILCELLPLPLPLPSPRPLTQQEVQVTGNSRKLWSAHIHCLSPALMTMIGDMAGCGYPGLVHQLQRVCEQLASLAPPTAGLVVGAVLEGAAQQVREENVAVGAKMIGFLAWMCGQPTLKTVLLHQAQAGHGDLLVWFKKRADSKG